MSKHEPVRREESSRGLRIVVPLGGADWVLTPERAMELRDELSQALADDLTADRARTQSLLDQVGVFDVSHSTERELLAVIRLLCKRMISRENAKL